MRTSEAETLYKVVLPSGKKTKAYSRSKISSALKKGQIPETSTVDVDGRTINVVTFSEGPAEVVYPDVDRKAWKRRYWWREAVFTVACCVVWSLAAWLGFKSWQSTGGLIPSLFVVAVLAIPSVVAMRIALWRLERNDPDPDPARGRLEAQQAAEKENSAKIDALLLQSVSDPTGAALAAKIYGIDLEAARSARLLAGVAAVSAVIGAAATLGGMTAADAYRAKEDRS